MGQFPKHYRHWKGFGPSRTSESLGIGRAMSLGRTRRKTSYRPWNWEPAPVVGVRVGA
jgi:hypothetical protein